jgi:hypothetical protein
MFSYYKKIFQSMESEYFLRTDLGVLRHFLFYRFDTNQRCSNDSRNSFENKTQNQRNHVYIDFVIYLAVSFPSHSKRAFSVLLEDSLRII